MEERLAKEVRLLFQSLDKKAQEKDDGDIYLLEGIGYYSRRTEKPVPPPEEDIHARIMREDEEDEENSTKVFIGENTQTDQITRVSQDDLHKGTYLLGAPGTGKSTLLALIALEQIELNESVILIDPRGDLINEIIARMPDEQVKNPYLLNLKNYKNSFSMQIFSYPDPTNISIEQRQAIPNQILLAFEKLWPEVNGQVYFKKMLRNIIPILLEHPVFTLAHVADFLADKDFRHAILNDVPRLSVRSFWREYDNWSRTKREDETSSFLNRMDELLSDQFVPFHICQKNGLLDIRKAIMQRKHLLIHLPVEEMAYRFAGPTIGTFLLLQIYHL